MREGITVTPGTFWDHLVHFLGSSCSTCRAVVLPVLCTAWWITGEKQRSHLEIHTGNRPCADAQPWWQQSPGCAVCRCPRWAAAAGPCAVLAAACRAALPIALLISKTCDEILCVCCCVLAIGTLCYRSKLMISFSFPLYLELRCECIKVCSKNYIFPLMFHRPVCCRAACCLPFCSTKEWYVNEVCLFLFKGLVTKFFNFTGCQGSVK